MSESKFRIEQIVIRILKLELKEPFTTSGWTTTHKTPLLVELRGGGVVGWGEGAVPNAPFYNHETPQTALHILRDFAVPLFLREKPTSPEALAKILSRIQRNGFARAALEMAYWDWTAKAAGVPLFRALGGERTEIPVGVSIGIQSSPELLVEKVGRYVEQGYKRIKLKVAPGRDLQFVEAVFRAFPNVPLMIDANSAYTLEAAKVFEEMNRYKLLMIEQPLHETDVYQHSLLAKRVTNPICLDESIESVRDAEAAIELGACSIINIKPGRVGGLTEARRIHDLCASRSVPVWCGGMLESGVGRAANMALATLPGFTLPGDISESSRYYRSDIVEPEIKFSQAGDLKLREEPGIGFDVNLERLRAVTELEEVVSVA